VIYFIVCEYFYAGKKNKKREKLRTILLGKKKCGPALKSNSAPLKSLCTGRKVH
jgi:hypothetical protein